MTSSRIEIIEAPAEEEPASCAHQFQSTISASGVDEKMKVILNLLEDDDDNSLLKNAEISLRKKETMKKAVQDLYISYRSLAEKYESLKSSSSRSSMKNMDDSQLETTDSNPESIVEDVDIDCQGFMTDIENIKRSSDNLVPKYGCNIRPEMVWSDGVKLKFSKLVEENTQLQVELIRRNSEKRETIIKLQNQVRMLRVENDRLQRNLSYFDRNKQHIQESSPSRKSILIDKFFRGCSP